MMPTAFVGPGVVLLALATLTACGGSLPSAGATTLAPSTVTATTTAGSPTSGRSTVATTSSTDTDRCHTSQLRLSIGPEKEALGNAGSPIVLANASAGSCIVYGYPGVALLDGNRHAYPTTVGRGSTYIAQDPKPHAVRLAPGAAAFATLGYTDNGQQPDCRTTVYLVVTPPDETAHLVAPIDGGRSVAVCGSPTVTALAAGSH